MFKIIIYLHENIDSDFLYSLLKKEKFEVISSIKIVMTKKLDRDHLMCSVVNNAVLLTREEYKYFPKIRHKGILIVYRRTDQRRKMPITKIIRALKNLRDQIEDNKITLENRILPLNLFI